MIDHPAAGANLRRALKNPMSAAGRAEGSNHSSGQAAKARIGSGTPRQSNARCMTDVGRRISEAVALDVTGRF
jgi:hypothetical protein